MNGAQLLARALEDEGADTLFGYPGGAILPFYDALYDSAIEHLLVRHEQCAVMAAEGYARATGRPGVCVATSGPGATNLITGIADAFLDSVPVVAITGQVPTGLMGSDAFQEVDVLGMTMPIVKHSFLVRDAQDLYRIARTAFRIARTGRPGPVWIDVPKDVQLADVDLDEALSRWEPENEEAPPPSPAGLTAALELLQAAERPLIYGGGGIFLGDAVESFRTLVETTGAPAVLTLKGLGALPGGHPQLLGMLGMHGSKPANLAVQACDLLLVCGARFDDRVTGKLEAFAPEARVIHLDIDPAEPGKRRHPDAPVLGRLTDSLEALSIALDIDPWVSRCADWKRTMQARYDKPGRAVYAPRFLRDLSAAAPEATVCCDVGQHQMWVAQHWKLQHPRLHLTSGGLGAMGFGLCAAIGVQAARPDHTVITVCGDGGILMNIQELATVLRHGLPLKIVVLDNSRLGMVRQWQQLFLDGRYSETDLSDNPDFCRVAEAFGVPAFRLDSATDERAAIRRLLETPGPLLCHVVIDPHENVWPFVPPGAPNSIMLEEA